MIRIDKQDFVYKAELRRSATSQVELRYTASAFDFPDTRLEMLFEISAWFGKGTCIVGQLKD